MSSCRAGSGICKLYSITTTTTTKTHGERARAGENIWIFSGSDPHFQVLFNLYKRCYWWCCKERCINTGVKISEPVHRCAECGDHLHVFEMQSSMCIRRTHIPKGRSDTFSLYNPCTSQTRLRFCKLKDPAHKFYFLSTWHAYYFLGQTSTPICRENFSNDKCVSQPAVRANTGLPLPFAVENWALYAYTYDSVLRGTALIALIPK